MLHKLQLYNSYFEPRVSLVGSVLTSMQGLIPSTMSSHARWQKPVISALGKLKGEDQEFDVILGYIVRSRPAWVT